MNINDFDITTDSQLKKICKDLSIKLNFIGFEEDIGRLKPQNGAYILNIGNDRKGTHWTCAFIDKKNMFYFDSYAVGPNDGLIEWAKQHKLNLDFNKIEQFQHLNESLCGIWCLAYLWHMSNTKGALSERFKKFSDKL